MRTKRILAIALALLMALSIIPFAAFAEGDPVIEDEPVMAGNEPKLPDSEKSIFNHLNAADTYIYWTNGNPGWTEKQGTTSGGSTYYYIESNNTSQDNTNADLTSETFYMNSGETIKFQYWFETEENYDKFVILDNGSEVFSGSGRSGGGSDPAWVNYTYTCTSSGDHTFVFRYHKDSSNSTGADCVRLYGLSYSRHYSWYLSRALMNEGMAGGTFLYSYSSQYPFYVGGSGSGSNALYLYNGNKNVANSTSYVNVSTWVERPVEFKFDYACESEANYDFFNFYVNDERVEHISGTGNYSWQTYTYTINTKGYYTFKFEYTKDGSNNGGADQVCIDNLRFSELDSEDRAADYNYTWYGEEANLNSRYSDAELTFNSPRGTASFVGKNSSEGSSYYAICNNRYLNDSEAVIETIVNMAQGETLSFQYYVSSEATYDRLMFYANDEEKLTASGWYNPAWTTYTFTAPSTKSYVFKWVYHKDDSNSYGLDYAAIANVRYTGSHSYGNANDGWGYHNAFSADQALIDTDSNDGDYYISTMPMAGYDYFMPYKDAGSTYMISRNRYYESTSAYMDIWCYNMLPGDYVTFDYLVSAESADKLHIIVDSSFDVDDYSYTVSGESSGAAWHSFGSSNWSCTVPGTVVIGLEFRKDYSVNSADDCAMVRNFAIVKATPPTLDEAMRKDGQTLTFTSTGTYRWKSGYHVTGTTSSPTVDLCAVPTNRNNLTGGGTATATVSTTAFLDYGDQFKFEYICDLNNSSYSDWTPNFTCTVQAPNTSTLLNLNQTANVTSWTTKTYTAFTTGLYTFTWTYTRPERGWEFEPNDEVCIRNCEIVDASIDWPSLDEALNVEGGTLHFVNGESGGWWGDYWFDDDIATSANIGEGSTNATITTTVQLNAGDRLRFQYYVSSEQDYDYLVFRVNNSTVFQESGLVEWEWYDWTAPSAGSYQFEWTYHKDSSLNRGFDCAKLDFVEVIRAGTSVLLGDVDGDGSVTVGDALLAMRAAMGLISLNATQIEAADVDHDGQVTVGDALLIMRAAMGLITLS